MARDYQFALVGEPTSMEVVHATKGSLWATLRATGKAAHSSQPERGDNAILKLTRALDRLDCHLGAQLATFTHPVLGRSTLNVGVIRGGTRPNIVPDLAEAEIDIRITPSLAAAGGALKLLKDTLEFHALPVEIVNPHENPPMETPPDHPMIQALLATRPGTTLAGAPWFSDAAHLSQRRHPEHLHRPGFDRPSPHRRRVHRHRRAATGRGIPHPLHPRPGRVRDNAFFPQYSVISRIPRLADGKGGSMISPWPLIRPSPTCRSSFAGSC